MILNLYIRFLEYVVLRIRLEDVDPNILENHDIVIAYDEPEAHRDSECPPRRPR